MASSNFSPIVGAQPVEWQEETDYATNLVADTDYQWWGISTSWSVDQGVESESITYLPEFGASNKLEKRVNIKLRDMYEGEMSYHPQNGFSFFQYFTGKDGGTSDTVDSIQVGEINESDDTYRRLVGGVGEEVTLSVAEDEVAEVSASFMFGDATNWTHDDYTGDGVTSLSADITPDNNEVSVGTDTVDTGRVIVYDASGEPLDEVSANSSTAQDTTSVDGTDVGSVQLVGVGDVTSETITVHSDTGGSGTSSETATMDSPGTHASEDTSEPLAFKDLGSVKYGGSEMDGTVESVELTISNELAVVRDANSSLGTQIESIIPVDREITVDIEMTYDNFDIVSDIRSYNAQTFEFTLGNTTFTVDGVKFPEAPYEFTADDLVSDSLSSDPADSLTWS